MKISELPVYTQAHIAIGLVGVGFGALALVLRLPSLLIQIWNLVSRRRFPVWAYTIASSFKRFHALAGNIFVLAFMLMPTTANWIWPRFGTPKPIINLILVAIFSVFLGVICIRLYTWLTGDGQLSRSIAPSSPVVELSKRGQAENMYSGTTNTDPTEREAQLVFSGCALRSCLLVTHIFCMIFAWVSLIGAGQAFLGNARTVYPYKRYPSDPSEAALTDQLVGRCTGRDLKDPLLPSWLLQLDCGFGPVCAESTNGGISTTTWK
eukprot:gb/GEZN01012082.1/.p1 GENE.gb/GEZN01012082.1/~~gb/GEZN01012082.1/.p1  ORF type:complete len:265 (-),score=18.92 gb/GEZN01012082.1/:255-1049(-)